MQEHDTPEALRLADSPAIAGLEHLESEIARLRERWREVERHSAEKQREAEQLAARNDELHAEKAALRQRVQELEDYVDGRASRWAALQQELVELRGTIAGLERARKAQELAIESIERGKRELEAQKADLARQNDELRAQGDEREAAYENLQRRFEDLRTAYGWLQNDVARLRSEQQRLAEKGAEDRALIESLERLLEEQKAATSAGATGEAHLDEEPAEELLPAECFLTGGPDDTAAPARGTRHSSDGVRKLVGVVGGAEIDFPLAKTEVVIGRGKTSDLRIASHYISRHHARISTRGIATTIEDAGSKNGIFVNRSRVERAILRDGDVVSLAHDLELKFVDARH